MNKKYTRPATIQEVHDAARYHLRYHTSQKRFTPHLDREVNG